MNLRFESLLGHSLEAAASLMTRGFEGYVVPVQVDAATFNNRFRQEHVDFAASLVAVVDDEPAALCLVARRGWTCRVAAMGVVKDLRGRGVGSALMRRCLDDARARGDQRVTLEVIESNAAARALYESVGFRNVRRLVGYVRDPMPDEGSGASLEDMDPAEFASIVEREGETGLPWMLAAPNLAAYTKPWRAMTLGGRAYALVVAPNEQSAHLRALLVPRAQRGRGHGQAMLEALFGRYPNRYWSVAAITPEGLGARLLERNGFRLDAISQYEMVCELNASS